MIFMEVNSVLVIYGYSIFFEYWELFFFGYGVDVFRV